VVVGRSFCSRRDAPLKNFLGIQGTLPRANFQPFKEGLLERPATKGVAVSYRRTIDYEGKKPGLWTRTKGFKVIHTVKNLFCYVALICNLVQEFNGLVSKGPAI
jgi:hypothetical protein